MGGRVGANTVVCLLYTHGSLYVYSLLFACGVILIIIMYVLISCAYLLFIIIHVRIYPYYIWVFLQIAFVYVRVYPCMPVYVRVCSCMSVHVRVCSCMPCMSVYVRARAFIIFDIIPCVSVVWR